ncbi:hypothetical protein [Methylobacterium sp. J-068]|uniref:hypothetical protein n=1 Tax=Methylobacterium sp. J-068 TaxID=2836649 RepID=UPI001FBB9B77|nr:hypothetical protein [Methylobacterium sp. J-068]MCJ2033052.1 hypothetical protein [Methylobacterium sp. J-068]
MEQGNCLDSTRMSARHDARDATWNEAALDTAVTKLLTAPSRGLSQPKATYDAPQDEAPDLGKPVDAFMPTPDAARALAARVIEYFGDEPIVDFLTADIEVRDMARALLDGVPYPAPAPRTEAAPDPILAAIDETRRLTWARNRAANLPQPAGSIDPLPEQEAATNAFFAHVDDVLLKTVPTTAAGCAALARYTVEFLADEGFSLDEDQASEQHVRILDLIARSPLLDGVAPVIPPAPDFSGFSLWELMRTYNAFKIATDVMGLTGWTISGTGAGHRLLNAEGDRLSCFQTYIADELARRESPNPIEATYRIDVLVNRAIACGDYAGAARFAAEADAKRL